MGKVKVAVRELLEYELGADPAGLNLDDCLWCYAYEPNCQKLRTAVNAHVGAKGKPELIDWCDTHTIQEQIDALEEAAHAG
jgi:hypothetical protein